MAGDGSVSDDDLDEEEQVYMSQNDYIIFLIDAREPMHTPMLNGGGTKQVRGLSLVRLRFNGLGNAPRSRLTFPSCVPSFIPSFLCSLVKKHSIPTRPISRLRSTPLYR